MTAPTFLDRLTAGDTVRFETEAGDYPASDGWSLVYKLIPRTSGTTYTITSTASGANHLLQVANTTTAGWAAGVYTWACYASKSGERYTLQTGALTIDADPGAATSLDLRTHAAKMLAAIESWLESRDPGVAEYQIAGRAMKYHPIAELVRLRNRYALQVQAEANAERLARGEGVGRKIQFRI